jgi:predicted nucleic acid binding AN1-type Zn finger protein
VTERESVLRKEIREFRPFNTTESTTLANAIKYCDFEISRDKRAVRARQGGDCNGEDRLKVEFRRPGLFESV